MRHIDRGAVGYTLYTELNATALTERKVHELLDKAVATGTLMVAVQEIGAAPVGHVGTWAARYNYCWFGVRGAAGGPQGRGGRLPCACLPQGLGGTAAGAPSHR
jgi:hypothetical protein